MTKRTLPIRATRGQLPSYLREPPSPVKKERVVSEQELLEVRRKETENRLRLQQVTNLRKYPFARVVHYFFDLDTFPRAKGHISYAVDSHNALNNTYSRDCTPLGSGTYGLVLNRQLFGLPHTPHPELAVRKQNRTKNVSYGYLFSIEDKKYQTDRLICTLRIVLKSLRRGAKVRELEKLEVLRKDPDLEGVLMEEEPVEEKIRVVEERLSALSIRKESSCAVWQPDDRLYFYHSLNQRLHDRILDLKLKLTQEHLLSILLHVPPCPSYYFSGERVFSPSLSLPAPLPVAILRFQGGTRVLKIASQIVAKRCESLGETTYYEAKRMVQKMFGFELSLRPEKAQNYPNYQKLFRKRSEQVKRMSATGSVKLDCPPLLDKYARNGGLSLKCKSQLSGKEYQLAFIFFWLCLGLHQLAPCLDKLPDLLGLISSDYFAKVHSYLVEATGSPQVGMLCSAIESLSDLFSKPDPLASVAVSLQFQFQSGVGVGVIFCSELEQNAPVSQSGLSPSKRVKRDESL